MQRGQSRSASPKMVRDSQSCGTGEAAFPRAENRLRKIVAEGAVCLLVVQLHPCYFGSHMRYLLAILCPPLAVLVSGRRVDAFLNLILTLCGWIPGVIHAFIVVNTYLSGRRANFTVDQMRAYRLNSVLRK